MQFVDAAVGLALFALLSAMAPHVVVLTEGIGIGGECWVPVVCGSICAGCSGSSGCGWPSPALSVGIVVGGIWSLTGVIVLYVVECSGISSVLSVWP